MNNAPHLAIIGAGASGLMAANAAQQHGVSCTVFDKARRAGGRMASRRSDWGSFNYGAPYVSVPAQHTSDERLQRALGSELLVQHLPSITGDSLAAWVPSDNVNSLAQAWSHGLNCHYQHTLSALKHDGNNWWLSFAEQSGWLGPFDRVLMTCPPVQAFVLLSKLPSQYALCKILQTLQHAPCWSVRWVPPAAAAFATNEFVRDDLRSLGIALCIREDLRPQGNGRPRLTLHTTAQWSADHLDDSSEWVANTMMRLAAPALGLPTEAEHLEAHRWRYAYVSQAAGELFLRGDNGLFYAGDACVGATIIDAMRSGLAAADALCAELMPMD